MSFEKGAHVTPDGESRDNGRLVRLWRGLWRMIGARSVKCVCHRISDHMARDIGLVAGPCPICGNQHP